MGVRIFLSIFMLVIVQSILKTDGLPSKTVFREDYTYLDATKSFYKIHKESTWLRAKEQCTREGATLFYPENEIEAKEVKAFWKRTHKLNSWVFIGISALLEKRVFETIDGRPLADVYDKWHAGEPNDNNGNEDCVIFRFDDELLNDDACNSAYYFICKKAVESEPTKNNGQQIPTIFRRDYTYVNTTEGFYKIHTEKKTWLEAKKRCATEGATLFYPQNANETREVTALWNQTHPQFDEVHIGISDLLEKGKFETIDGQPIDRVYHNWAADEPRNCKEEDCVILQKGGGLKASLCDRKKAFICRKAREHVHWNDECNMPDKDYVYNADTGTCHKFHPEPQTWAEAYKVCSAEMSYLAVINSQAEAVYLNQLAVQAKKNTASGLDKTTQIHLGFHNLLGVGWITVKGESLAHAGYSTWSDQNPDGGDNEKCGSMYFKPTDQAAAGPSNSSIPSPGVSSTELVGRLNGLGCDQRTFYICEHDLYPCEGSNYQ